MPRIQFANTSPAPVLVVGSVAYDDIETPRAASGRVLGGSASFCAFSAAFYAPVRLVGVVGDDFLARDVARLEARGIDLAGLKHEAGPTFYWHGRYHENFSSRDTLDIRLGVFEHFRPVLPAAYRETPYILLGNIAPALQSAVLDALTSAPRLIVADSMDLWINIAREDLLALVARVDVLILNDSEFAMLTGEPNVLLAAKKLRALGPKTVIVKKGEHGAILFHEEGRCALPAYPVEQLEDPTGAGDSFAGAFIGYLAAHHRTDFAAMRTALAYAIATASITVEAFSCDRLEKAGAAEISRRVDILRTLTTF